MIFEKDVIVLGREAECDLALTRDDAVSSKHALLARGSTCWTIKDLRSKNGLYVEGHLGRDRVETSEVSDGQVLVLGQSRIRVDLSNDRKDDKGEVASYKPEAQSAQTGDDPDRTTLLRIGLDKERLKFQMISEGAIGTQHTLPLVASDMQEVVARFHDIMSLSIQRDPVSRQIANESSVAVIQALGEFLSFHLLPVRIREKLCKMKEIPLLLLLEPQVVGLPWELAILDGVPLCLKFSVGRQVVVDDNSTVLPRLAASNPMRLMVVSTPTEDLPEAYAQAQDLFRWLRSISPAFLLDFVAGARVERIPLLTNMNGSEIVYFVGHAESDERNPMNSGWLLRNGRITCMDFMSMKHPPSFIFANGCQTGREHPRDGVLLSCASTYGMASSFILSGVQSYLGVISDVDARAAGLFARSFFGQLLMQGASIGESLRLARLELRKLLGDENLAWSTYVLYGSPSRRYA